MFSIITAMLYRMGGEQQWKWLPINQKFFRRFGIGLFIGITWALILKSWIPLLCIPAYIVAETCFAYGDTSWLFKLVGAKWQYFIVGVAFGLASAPVLLWWAIPQAILSGAGFLILHILDDKNIVKNPWQEAFRGAAGVWMMDILLILIRR